MTKNISNTARICAVMQHHDYLVSTDPTYRANRRAYEADIRVGRLAARTSVIRIPVVVHVIYNTASQNIKLSQITSQIDALNRDYRLKNTDRADVPAPFQPFVADTLIEFALAVRDPQGNPTKGITRTQTTKTGFPYVESDPQATMTLDSMIKNSQFGKIGWPRDSYLNLWVCNITGGLLGYAQFPGGPSGTDGVVIANTAFGSGGIAKSPYNLGRTAVHEVGHWLDLLHIWGDDRGGCSGSDNVSDTPNQANSNGSGVRKSSFPHITCGNQPHGDMFMNYMDYVDDETMVMFTKDQVGRMNATLAGPRSSLATSSGLTPITPPQPPSATHAARVSEGMKPLVEQGECTQYEYDGVSWVSL